MQKETEKPIETSKKSTRRVHFYIINFVRLMLILAFLGAILNKRWLVLFVSAFALIVTFLPFLLEKRWGLRIPAEFEIITLLFIYGTLFFGEIRGFYARFWWWDVLLNLGASLALGFVGLTILYVLYKDEKLDASPLIITVFTFCFALAAGTIWEIFEFTADTFFGFTLQKNSLLDTMSDIIVNAIGAFFVAITGFFYIRDGELNFISKFITMFIEKNPMLFRAKKKETVADKLKELINKGESERLEFKSTLRINLHTGEVDKKIEFSFLKTIVAYLNSQGGTLLVGVKDNGEIIGTEKEGFINKDKLRLHITNLIKNNIGKEYFHFIDFDLVEVDNKNVLKIESSPSDKPVFLKANQEEEFHIRNGPSTVRLSGSNLLDYVERRFKK